MNDRTDAIVDAAIAHTTSLLADGSTTWCVAREGLLKILADLASATPDHPALERLRRFVAESDRVFG